MLTNENGWGSTTEARYNVILNGVTVRYSVPKFIAESYIKGLNENEQGRAKLVPVTEDGKEILLG
jgi:hypothetical protein